MESEPCNPTLTVCPRCKNNFSKCDMSWFNAERIRDLPAVNEALTNFSEDSTGDNATCIVREVIEQTASKQVVHISGESPEAVQWRNINHVVRTLADWGFGNKDDPKWGTAWVCMVNGLTAKDGPNFKLEPLPMSKDVVKQIEGFEDRVAELIGERNLASIATHRQAYCINQCAAILGPKTSATIEGLPKAIKHLKDSFDELKVKFEKLEAELETERESRRNLISSIITEGNIGFQ